MIIVNKVLSIIKILSRYIYIYICKDNKDSKDSVNHVKYFAFHTIKLVWLTL